MLQEEYKEELIQKYIEAAKVGDEDTMKQTLQSLSLTGETSFVCGYLDFLWNRYETDDDLRYILNWCLKEIENGGVDKKAKAIIAHKLGEFYLYGYLEETPIDVEKQIYWFSYAADQDYAYAQALLGGIYADSSSKFFNAKKAFDYTYKAAKNGWDDSFISLAMFYMDGIVVKKDYQRAKEILEYALSASIRNANAVLGSLYCNEGFEEYDYQVGVEYLKEAINLGETLANYDLGWCYYLGDGTAQDYKKAFQCFQEASYTGYPPAIRKLGLCYRLGHGVEQNDEEAFKCFQKGAQKDDVGCLFYEALCYSDGLGTEQDYKKAISSYEKVIEISGDATAEYNLALLYLDGLGTEVNGEKGIQLLLSASSKGETAADYSLGCVYFYGEFVEKDIQKAKEYFEKAASNGVEEAIEFLKENYST